jgi:protein-tyrosine-phosphatase
MAEALTKLMYGDWIQVDSCGLRPEEGVDPFAEFVVDEAGGDLSRHRGKSFDDLIDGSFDLVISLTPHAQHRAVEMARGRAVEIEYWPIMDPTLATGSRQAVLEAYRATREDLRRRILARFGRPSTFDG